MYVDVDAKVLFKSENFTEYWSNINTVTKYPKLRETAKPFLFEFHTTYMVEAGLSHVKAMEQINPAEPQRFVTKAHTFSTKYQQSCCYSPNTPIPLVPTILLHRCVNIALMLAIFCLA